MTSEQNHNPTPGNTSHGTGSLTPDAGPDTSRADDKDAGVPSILYPDVQDSQEQADLNDDRHDYNNVDHPVPDSTGDQEENVVNRQLGIIGRISG